MPRSEMEQLLDARQAVLDRHEARYRTWRYSPTLTNAMKRDDARREVELFGDAAKARANRAEEAIDQAYEERGLS
jgi:hypothetical protein